MPLSLDPSRTARVSLASDLQKPEADRPTFVTRFPTARQALALREARERAVSVESDAESIAILTDACATVLVGWERFGDRAFSRDALGEVLTLGELLELTWRLVSDTSLQEVDLKKLESPSPSSPASAGDAPPATAPAA